MSVIKYLYFTSHLIAYFKNSSKLIWGLIFSELQFYTHKEFRWLCDLIVSE